MKPYKVIVVGAGPAGIGISVLLKKAGIDYIILEKDTIASSFKKWTKETRFISPSFNSNGFEQYDLNSITTDSSPAAFLKNEHPTGKEYGEYLEEIVKKNELLVKENTFVEKISKKGNDFILETNNGEFSSKYIIWAAGEFQYPNENPFKGAENGVHTSKVKTWDDFKDEEYFVIGAYESGFDSAINLAKLGKKITLFDEGNNLSEDNPDSSFSLSVVTREKYEEVKENIKIINKKIKEIEKKENNFIIKCGEEEFASKTKPFLATGFKTSLVMVKDLFEFKNSNIILNEFDESTITNGLFLAGPGVRHEEMIYCFIYKFRTRFARIVNEISKREKNDLIVNDFLVKEKIKQFRGC